MNSIINTLQINQRGIICFVGAGGKTTLMLQLAEALALTESSILITTTTKIFPPEKTRFPHLVITDEEETLLMEANERLERSKIIVAASRSCSDTKKLIGFEPAFIDDVWNTGRFKWILTEGDGSARKPIKAPANHEPVVPKETKYLFGVIGLSVLGKPLNDDNVHRKEYLKNITGLQEGEKISASAIAKLIQHRLGLFKNCPPKAKAIAFLNQADALQDMGAGILIKEYIYSNAYFVPDIIVFGQAQKTPMLVDFYTKETLG